MAKKCIPGVICVENMTLFLIVFLFVIIFYLFHQLFQKNSTTPVSVSNKLNVPPLSIITPTNNYLAGISTRMAAVASPDPLTDPYVPPTRDDTDYYVKQALLSAPRRAAVSVPVPITTRPYDPEYRQIGILTRNNDSKEMILPLMGRRQLTARDKWQYYTISGGAGGNFQTKLPIRVKGRSCTGDYGCDEIYSGDQVYVEGFKETFAATVYENSTFSYTPF
jgi:hypothetical protein